MNSAGISGCAQGRSSLALRIEVGIVSLILIGFVAAIAPSLDQPLLERHEFRQTQTAYTARIFHEQGIDLLHPKLPVLGDPFEAPFEFPLFQAAASVVMDAGVRDDVAMRITGLACFLLTALLLYGLVRYVAGRASAIPALVAFVATPFAFMWGRASMIEYLATAGAVGFTWATIAFRENGRQSTGALALIAGLVGMLVKPTTAVFWLIPALAYRPGARQPGGASRRVRRAWLAGIVLVPLAAAGLWTRHADEIKAASPTTAWLTSDALKTWNFGTMSQRLSFDTWHLVADRAMDDIVGPVGLVLLVVAAVAVVKSSQRLFWIGIALAALLPPLVFTNLYWVHDYYLAALTPAVAALIGLGAGFVWGLVPDAPLARGAAIALGLVLALNVLVVDRGYATQIYVASPDDSGARPLAQEISGLTRPEDRVAVVGLDWSPAVLYYANRWGLMVVDRNAEISYDLIQRHGYRYLVVAAPDEADLGFLARWRWVGALGPHTYGIAEDVRGLPESGAIATDEPAGVHPGDALGSGVTVRCGETTTVPTGERGTLFVLGKPSAAGKLNVSDRLAPMPTRKLIYVAPGVSEGGRLSLGCSGPASLDVDVYEAAAP